MGSSTSRASKEARPRLLVAVTASFFFALSLVTWAAASASDEGQRDAEPAEAKAPGWLREFLVAPPGLASRANAEATKDQEASETDAARQLRDSRTKFRDLSGAEAAESAREQFPQLVAKAVDPAPELVEGERIAEYPTSHAARVELPGGRNAVVESLLPLTTTTAKGERVPVDLAVREADEALVPNHPIVPIRIPGQLDTGLELPGLDLRILPSDASGRPLSGQASVEGAVAHYANVQPDTDLIVRPVPLGLQTHTIVRSPVGPERFFFRIEVGGEGAPTLRAVDGDVVMVESDGRVITAIPPARARDAGGRHVPVSTQVDGNTLVLSIDHRDKEVQYPIDLDPTVADYNGFASWEGEHNWVFETNASSVFESEWDTTFSKLRIDNGEYPYNRNGYNYGDYGAWFYLTQGVSRIYKLEAEASLFVWGAPGGQSADGLLQIAGSSGPEGTSWFPTSSVCATGGCPSSGGSAGNAAVVELIAIEGGEQYISLALDEAYVRIVQDEGAAIEFNEADPEINGKPNALYEGGGWLKSSDEARIEFTATDPGLGLSFVSVDSPGYGPWDGDLYKSLGGCIGVQCDPTYSTSRSLGNLPEGEREIEVKAFNAAISSEASRIVKIDNGGPVAEISGLGSSYVAGLGESVLDINVVDGTETKASSGVAADSIAVFLDGEQVLAPGGEGCSPGPCEVSRELSFVGRELGVGEHVLEVTAVDAIGNEETTQFPVVVENRGGSMTDLGPGQLDLKTGDFFLAEADVGESATNGSVLSVTRTHESLRLDDPTSVLGPAWHLSLGVWRRGTVMHDGTFVLADSKGRQVVFAKTFNGYQPPAEYAGWDLAYDAEADVYELTGPSRGTTTFRRPTNGPEYLYAPWVTSGPDGEVLTTQHYNYHLASGGLRPQTVAASIPPEMGASGCNIVGEACKQLDFRYDSTTTATGNAPEEWGDYEGRLSRIIMWSGAWADPWFAEDTVVEYAYDAQGRLRAAWDPRISPALKTTYGYDSEGRVSAVNPPGQQPWLLRYGRKPGSPYGDWLLSASRPDAAAELGADGPPEYNEAPHLGESSPRVGGAQHIWLGSWDHEPTEFLFQWEACDAEGKACQPINGGTAQTYSPTAADIGKTLRGRVTAINSLGSETVYTPASSAVALKAPPSYALSIGSSGSEEGELSTPGGVATDAQGNVWVADTGNDRIQKFDSDGNFLAAYGESGSGEGQFSEPTGIAIDPFAPFLVYVADSGNDRVQVFWTSGEYVASVGESGSGESQFDNPTGIAVYQFAHALVVDSGNDRIQKVRLANGKFLGGFGSQGSEPGQLEAPTGIARTVDGRIFVADTGNDRVQEFDGEGEFVRQFSTSQPRWLDGDRASYRLLSTAPDGARQSSLDGGQAQEFGGGEGPGELVSPQGIDVDVSGTAYVGDAALDVVKKFVSAEGEEEAPPGPPDPPQSATWSVAYDVPLSGEGAPYPMQAPWPQYSWGQEDVPTEATAIFPPDEVPPGAEPQSYDRATVHYMNDDGRIVNVLAPGGRLKVEEYDDYGNVERTLTPENHARVMAVPFGERKALAGQLDTQFTYSEDGSKLLSVVGPRREVELEGGEQVEARSSTKYSYDEGAPQQGGPYGLVTKQTEGALVGGEEHDVRSKTFEYGGQEGLGWKLRQPTSETVDPGGLNLTSRTLYDEKGNVIETRMPGNPEGGDAHASQAIYYTALENQVEECGERPDLVGLVCQTRPAAQPETSGLPDLPVTTITYDIYLRPTVTTEVVGESVRTATIEYDDAGRPLSTQISSTGGKALPKVQVVYDEESGLPTVQATETESIVSEYDSLGQLTSYTDGDGNTSTFAYDSLGRPTEVSDGKGSQSISYDATTGDLTAVVDSAAGAFSAEHDAGGKMTSMTLPNGLEARYAYDSGGSATALEYVDTTACSEECAWFQQEATPSIHGETLSESSTQGALAYGYDAAGRLVEARETPQGEGCTTRLYSYDADTNRTAITTRGPAEGGACAGSGGETQTTAFDEADRLLGEGVEYDDFGNISNLPAAYAGGKLLSSTYYADDSAATLSQNGTTIEYLLDPAGRERETLTDDGEAETSLVSHFSGAGDSPAWTEDGSGNWTRYIGAMGGLAAIQSSTGGIELQIADLGGDIIATAPVEEVEELDFIGDATEYGVPQGEGAPARYSWLGSAQRPTELESGVVNMGARTYVPEIGRFLQTDPVEGGSANAYAYVHGDPVGETDVSGEYTPGGSAPPWLREAMENPPGMPPPPPPPSVEAELEEELFFEAGGDSASASFLFPVSVIPGGEATKTVAGAVKAVWVQVASRVLYLAGQLAARFGSAVGRAFKTAVRYGINAAKGGARTAKSVAQWVKRQYDVYKPELIKCGQAAFNAVLSSHGDWKLRAALGANACRDAIKAWRSG